MHRYGQWKGLFAVVAVSLWLASVGFAQEKGAAEKPGDKGAAKSSKESSKEAPPAKESIAKSAGSKRRLPRYYGKLGLSEAQRDKIYGVQEKHAAEIEKLEKQLSDLKEKQEADCRKVLTADQRKQLTEALDAAKTRSKGKDDGDEMEG